MGTLGDTAPLWIVAAILATAGVWLNAVHKEVKQPYMDEVFHVGQAKRYLDGRWTEWDPKITTPPGLYVLSTLFRWGTDDVLLRLRALNTCLVSCVGVIVYWSDPRPNRLHTAINIALFPPLFFFCALFYTDIASTVSVLAFWAYFSRVRATWTFAQGTCLTLLGLLSLTFRQTNIFWVAVFPAGLTLVDLVELKDPIVDTSHADDYLYLCLGLVKSLLALVISRPSRLVRLAPYLTTLVCFAVFVVCNGGVVLGDKANHVASLHLAQVLYLWPYMVFFSVPLLLPYYVNFLLRTLRNDPIPRPFIHLAGWTIATLTAVAIVRYSTVVHPFILADNRHYVFYVFKFLLRHPAVQYAAIPVYLLCAWASIQALGSPLSLTGPRTAGRGVRISWVLVWFATCVLQLSTAPLVEPRYSIIPWIMWRLHISRPQGRTDYRLWLETVWFLAVNAGTGYMFLYHGFAWPQEPGKTQRFIW